MKILFVQELLPSYRKKIFNELAVEEEVQLSVLTGDTHKDYGILSEKVFFDLTHVVGTCFTEYSLIGAHLS